MPSDDPAFGCSTMNHWWSAGFLLTLLAGCAAQPASTPSAAQSDPSGQAVGEYRRADARIQVLEQFEARRRQCAAQGGAMHIPRQTSGRLPPDTSELRLAVCSSRRGPVDW
jgi:hypothetical protein